MSRIEEIKARAAAQLRCQNSDLEFLLERVERLEKALRLIRMNLEPCRVAIHTIDAALEQPE